MVRKSRKSREEWKIYNNVFDQFTIRNLFQLSTQGYFKELLSPIALGKEANVFYAEKTDGTSIIVKIYRLENCNFNKMYEYIRVDPRFSGLENQRRKIIFSWVQREFRNLMLARENIKVPTPITFKDNILVMEYIGEEQAAPPLKNLVPKNPQDFFDKTIKNVKKLIKAGLVHADLSEFNILNHNEEPVFIDFSQSTPINTHNAEELLERDLNIICKYFSKFIDVDSKSIISEMKEALKASKDS